MKLENYVTYLLQTRYTKLEPAMLVPLITFETISAIYGEAFAKTWFRPFSPVRPTH